MKSHDCLNRRQFLGRIAAISAAPLLVSPVLANSTRINKIIPSSAEPIPVIGMGSSRTFEASGDAHLMQQLLKVTQAFFDMGGGMIDSSPMYGSAEQVIGQLLPRIKGNKNLFAATKVWTNGKQNGIEQMEQSRQLWGIKRFDLIQIHNLVDWPTHLETLRQMKADGRIRYLGITTSHGRSHRQLQDILQTHEFDFLQLSYNIANRDAEARLLPIAREKGIAVIINRPFQRGNLFAKVRGKALPGWSRAFGCNSWAQFFLKYAVSHPAVTCAIPATSKVKHMRDNMQAGVGRLPDHNERLLMQQFFEQL